MKGEDLPEDDHIVRYVKPSMIQEDGFPDGAEFRLRPSRPDEMGLSVNWLEAFDPGKQRQLAEVRRLYRLSMKHRGRFAELNVGAVRTAVTEELETLRVVHDPLGTLIKISFPTSSWTYFVIPVTAKLVSMQ